MRKLAIAAAISAAFFVSGCAPVALVGGAMATGAALYCAGVSEAGRVLVRAAATEGRKVIACGDTLPGADR